MTESGFVKGQLDNLPRIDPFMMSSYFISNPNFTSAEVKGVKAASRCTAKKMANNWTSVADIMRDLSMVQGCGVPANIEQTVGAYDRPSTPDLSDEEHHDLCTVDFQYPPPDLGLIKEMLNIVRDKDVSSDEQSQCDLQISKKCDEIKASRKIKNVSPQIETTTIRKSNNRNVALTSILQIQSEKSNMLKLLKPDDLVSTDVEESVQKVKGWLNAQTSNNKETNNQTHNPFVLASPQSGKKSVVLQKNIMFKKKTAKSPKDIDPKPITEHIQKKTENYKPTEYADKLYKELKDRQRLKAIAHEDIWSRAERQMKEIEEKRKLEAATSSSSELESTKSQSIDLVRLSQHRHLLTGECIVCEIMKKHNFDIDIKESTDFDVFFNTLL